MVMGLASPGALGVYMKHDEREQFPIWDENPFKFYCFVPPKWLAQHEQFPIKGSESIQVLLFVPPKWLAQRHPSLD